MKKFNYAPILTIVSVLMILAMLVVTFIPCWQIDVTERIDGEKVTFTKDLSISSFIWNTKEYKDLSKDVQKQINEVYPDANWEFVTNDEAFMPALLLVFGVCLSIFSLIKMKSLLGPLSALCLGLFSLSGYANSFFLFFSAYSVWTMGYYLGIAAAAVGGICVVLWLIPYVLKKKKEHEERMAYYAQ